MNILLAEAALRQAGPDSTRLSEVYDDDKALQSAMSVLIPGFEYPDHSHKTLGELRRRYFAVGLPFSG